jgi:hypothetical protein
MRMVVAAALACALFSSMASAAKLHSPVAPPGKTILCGIRNVSTQTAKVTVKIYSNSVLITNVSYNLGPNGSQTITVFRNNAEFGQSCTFETSTEAWKWRGMICTSQITTFPREYECLEAD